MILYGDVVEGIAMGLDLCPTDSRVRWYTNRGVKELMDALDDFKGKHVRLRLCVTSGNITWPAYIETIERALIEDCCVWKTKMRDFWFEFMDNSVPPQDQDRQWFGGITADRSDAVTFDSIRGPNKKLKIYTDVPEEAGATVRLTGTGPTGTQIRQQYNSVWQAGETLTLSNVTPPTTTNTYASVDGVFFSSNPRNGYARLYEVDTVTNEERLLAIYEPWQNRPTFRQSFISGMCSDVDVFKTVQIIGKRGFIPITSNLDVMIIGNENALIEITKAIKDRDSNLPTAKAHRDAAIKLMDDEFRAWRGMSPEGVIQFQRAGSWGFGRANIGLGSGWGMYGGIYRG